MTPGSVLRGVSLGCHDTRSVPYSAVAWCGVAFGAVGTILVIGGAIVVVIVTILGALAARQRARRRVELALVARRHGFEFSDTDPFDCTRISFALFRRGDGRAAENLMWRNGPNELPVRGFDFWFYDEHRDDNGRTHRRYTYRTCVLAQVNGSWPEVFIARERMLDKLLGWAGAPDVEFESEEFNRTFVVRCDDARFATALVDPEMMTFLLATQGVVSFSMKGRWLLLETTLVKPALVPTVMRLADEFVKRIPRVVWELYPTPFLDEDGRHLPAGDEHLAALREASLADDPPTSPFQPLFDHLEADGVDYDLDGKPVPKREEDPWGRSP